MERKIPQLEKKAFQMRKRMLEMCIKAGTGHVTSSLSCMDILVALYHGGILKVDPKNPQWEDRDRLILSKGQASPGLYTVLADRGFYPEKELDKFAQEGGKFGVHLQGDVPGVELTCGSLGQGFGVAAGMALGAKINRQLHLVFAIIGDGECYEGSMWETAMFAAHHRLNNFVAILDRNYLCVTDFTENLIELEPMDAKWESFGWEAVRIDGNDFRQILCALQHARARRVQRPLIVIADTTKGCGIDRISNMPIWHGLAPKGNEADLCKQDLERRYCHE